MIDLDVKILLLLKSIPGLGCSKINKIYYTLKSLNNHKTISSILDFNLNELLGLGLNHKEVKYILKPDFTTVEKQIHKAQQLGIDIITIASKNYPEYLKNIHDPPIVLYTKGNAKILNAELMAIVGTRRPTIYGLKMAEHFSNGLMDCGYLIVSGFARGVDITAHVAALKRNLPTVVVLGTSLDCIYPAEHQKYVNKVLDSGGVIISENPFTTPPKPSCFPKRNRIISGLSKGTMVVEAARKSGSLISARCAMEQGREVFALPGNINNPQALGCLDLIANGAKLVITVEDIIEELRGMGACLNKRLDSNVSSTVISKVSSDVGSGITRDNLAVISQTSITPGVRLNTIQESMLVAISGGVVSFDQIVSTMHLDAAQIAAQLVQLEIMGLIAAVPGGYTCRA